MSIKHQDQQKIRLTDHYPAINASFIEDDIQPNKQQTPKQTSGQPPRQIIHKVIYGDTLEGLSLTYDVSISSIKQRNKLQSDQIYYLKQIVIPNPRVHYTQTIQYTEQMMIQQFMMHMDRSEVSAKTARYYLAQSEWKFERALQEYRKDLQWQKSTKNKNKMVSIPLSNYNPLNSMKKRKDE